MLTSEQVLHFHTFGFLVVKRAFSLKEMQDIINVFDESMLEDRDGQPFDGEERQAIFGVFERNSYLVNLIVDQRIFGAINQLFGPGLDNIHIISTDVNGNDLIVEYLYFNNFYGANLENANFKNASVWTVMFDTANLSNANFSGADLRRVHH